MHPSSPGAFCPPFIYCPPLFSPPPTLLWGTDGTNKAEAWQLCSVEQWAPVWTGMGRYGWGGGFSTSPSGDGGDWDPGLYKEGKRAPGWDGKGSWLLMWDRRKGGEMRWGSLGGEGPSCQPRSEPPSSSQSPQFPSQAGGDVPAAAGLGVLPGGRGPSKSPRGWRRVLRRGGGPRHWGGGGYHDEQGGTGGCPNG